MKQFISVQLMAFGAILLNSQPINCMQKVNKTPKTRSHISLNLVNEELFNAIIDNKTEVVKVLLNIGANPNARSTSKTGWTPLHYAAMEGNIDIITLLLKHHPEVNAVTSYGVTPLHIAVSMHNEETVRTLLTAGANPFIKNKYEQTAIDHAMLNGTAKLALLMQEWKK